MILDIHLLKPNHLIHAEINSVLLRATPFPQYYLVNKDNVAKEQSPSKVIALATIISFG